jgi:hypothetical protein
VKKNVRKINEKKKSFGEKKILFPSSRINACVPLGASYVVSQMSPETMTTMATPLVPVIVAAASFTAGAIVSYGIELSLREFEENCKVLSYEARWWTSQGIRVAIVGAGTTLTVTALLGLIGTASLLAVVSIASCGIGLAVVAGVGCALALERYASAKKKDAEAYRNTIISQLSNSMDQLSDESIQQLKTAHKITHLDITTILFNDPDTDETGVKFLRLRRLLK